MKQLHALSCLPPTPRVPTHASLPQTHTHILNCFHSSLPSSFPRVCLCVCFTLLCCSFPRSSPCFDVAGSWNFQPHSPRHQKFIEPGKQTCEAARRDSGPLTLPLFLSPIFCPLSSSSRPISLIFLSLFHLTFHLLPFFLPPPSLFLSPFSSLSPPLSLWQFSLIATARCLFLSLPLPPSLVAV